MTLARPFQAGLVVTMLVFPVASDVFARAPAAADRPGRATYRTLWNGQHAPEEGVVELTFRDGIARLAVIPAGKPAPAAPEEATYIDFGARVNTKRASLRDGSVVSTATPHDSLPALEFTTEHATILGYDCVLAKAVQRSNHYDLWVTRAAGVRGTPSADFVAPDGLVLRLVRNGNFELVAERVDRGKAGGPLLPDSWGDRVDAATYRARITEAWITRVTVFDRQVINWSEGTGPRVEGTGDAAAGPVHRFAGGTVVAREVVLPDAPDDAMVMAHVVERSRGDAYDRTGSIFVIPRERGTSFLDALRGGVAALPVTTDRDGNVYQGMIATPDYLPPLELVRFITPFGIGHFNQRSRVAGLGWEDSALYRVDVTDLLGSLRGPVWIGAFIGNYDQGGHELGLRLDYHAGSREEAASPPARAFTLPLFNTVNVMEMAGQSYGKLFLHDTLRVEFEVPEGLEECRLRYLSTGHGGWEHGDEFNPRPNTILVDGEVVARFTPWRTDCASFRRLNPSTGNFWNGIASSDLSRSGWCPGAPVNPVIVPLPQLGPGRHEIRVAIPMGAPEGPSSSSWCVSGVLLAKYAARP